MQSIKRRFLPKLLMIVCLVGCLSGFASQVSASAVTEARNSLKQSSNQAYVTALDDDGDTYGSGYIYILETISGILWSILQWVGSILILIIIYAGWQYMTAGGNQDQVSKAQKWLKNAVIGLAIIVMANLISAVFMEAAIKGTTQDRGGLLTPFISD